MVPPPSQERPEHSVAMWGAPSSGKTTFLAALSLALARQARDWRITGADDASTNVLIRLTTALSRDRAFPDATSGMEHYRWLLNGQVRRPLPRRWFRTEYREESVRIGLDLTDASGEIFDPDKPGRGVRSDLVDNLTRSRGIIFLFDPIREFEQGDVFDHTFGVLTQLAQRMDDSPDLIKGRLPHYVAICVTKFDEIRVLSTADKLSLVVSDPDDPYDFPRVDDSDARDFFAHLCRVSQSGNAELVPTTLERYFRPERVKYFVTSAIGFHVNPGLDVYDPDDYQNQLPDEDEPRKTRIRGTVHPINVVEPILWLAGKLTSEMGELA